MPDLELKRIQPNKLNPRLRFSKSGLDDLAASIKQYGILEPIIVRPVNSHYEVVVGERRYRAAQQAGLDEVPVIVREYDDDEVMEINLVENVQREDLSAVEKAKLCQELRTRYPDKYVGWDIIADRIGVEVDTVRAWVRTLNLPEEIRDRIAPRELKRVPEGKIDYRTALDIAEKIKDPERQVEVATHLAEERMPREVAREVIRRAATPDPVAPRPVAQIVQEAAREPRASLAFTHRHYQSVVSGEKQQTTRRRADPRIEPGTIVRADVIQFADLEITDVIRKRLGEMTEQDAREEGDYTLDEFRDLWRRSYGSWNPDELVTIIRFQVARVL
ncbi:MAG TPA: ParB/RepB/Spo0J family partition protein [Chloroflexota bacterium]|nr:ParB/RepB/Spo0J family partition protein [Chloroflexota bacterium]